MFEIGDQIRVKPGINLKKDQPDSMLSLLEHNKFYTVMGVDGAGDLMLEVKNDPDPQDSWGAQLFELVPKSYFVQQFIKNQCNTISK